MSSRTCCCKKLSLVFALLALAVMAVPAFAQDNVPYFCNGSSGTTCTLFQLDGSSNTTANADTCVGGEFACTAGEQDPVWPADWDALLYPSALRGAGTGFSVISGTPPGPYTFATPWGSFGSFSGVITSTLVSTGTSTILKQGTKNTDDLSKWVVAAQASPPKDAYLAGAIASYVAPPAPPDFAAYAGHQILYLGSTRFSPNGSATIGIWFFQENVVICSSGKALCSGSSTGPVANHRNKDLFLFLTFSGNGTAVIQTAEWNCSTSSGNVCSPAGSGSLGPATSLVTCGNGVAAGTDAGCAVTNAVSAIILGKSTTTFQAPGQGFNVSGSGFAGFANGVVPSLQFQEAGIDLNQIFGGAAPCFSSVLFASVTSGSSPSTASMKSILLGTFNTCSITVNKECLAPTSTNTTTGEITYPIDGTVENTGTGSISGLSLTDFVNGSTTPTAFDTGSLTCTCGPSGCTISTNDCSTVTLIPAGTVTYNATITTTQNGPTDQVTATMGGAGGGSASATSTTVTCPTVSFNTGVSISKACTTGATLQAVGGVLEVEVGVGGTITNHNGGSLALTNVTVHDCIGGTFTPPTLDTNGCPTPTAITNSVNSCATNGGTLSSTVAPLSSTTIAGGTTGNTEAWSDTYFPSVPPACGTNNSFSDQALVTGDCSSSFCTCAHAAGISATAICPLCPNACPSTPGL